MASAELTTVRVVAPDTPSAVGGASKPSNVAITVTAMPNTKLLITPLNTSSRTSTAACIWDQNWPGFQVVPGGSRVFLAVTAQPVITEASRSPRQRVYHIERGRILLSNNRRPLITEAFNTPLARAWLRPAGRGVDLVLELRADAEPTIAQEAGPQGFQFVYVNLPPWQAPEIARVILPNGAAVSVTADPRATPVPGGAPGAPAVTPVVAPARGPMIDNERPPGR